MVVLPNKLQVIFYGFIENRKLPFDIHKHMDRQNLVWRVQVNKLDQIDYYCIV